MYIRISHVSSHLRHRKVSLHIFSPTLFWWDQKMQMPYLKPLWIFIFHILQFYCFILITNLHSTHVIFVYTSSIYKNKKFHVHLYTTPQRILMCNIVFIFHLISFHYIFIYFFIFLQYHISNKFSQYLIQYLIQYFLYILEIKIHWGGLQFESKRLKECKNWVFIISGP